MTIGFPQDSVTKYAKAAKYFVDIFPSRTKYKLAHDWSKKFVTLFKMVSVVNNNMRNQF